MLNFVRVAVQSRKVNLMSIDRRSAGSVWYVLPVDRKLQEITVSISGTKPRAQLVDPDGMFACQVPDTLTSFFCC